MQDPKVPLRLGAARDALPVQYLEAASHLFLMVSLVARQPEPAPPAEVMAVVLLQTPIRMF